MGFVVTLCSFYTHSGHVLKQRGMFYSHFLISREFDLTLAWSVSSEAIEVDEPY